jgi:hypothetical protein
MRAGLLLTLYAGWPVAVVVARLVARVRARFLLVSAGAWLVALVIGTTATPARLAAPVGLIVGAIVCVIGAYSVTSGVTFEWDHSKTYDVDDGPKPRAEYVVLGVVALIGAAGIALAVTA